MAHHTILNLIIAELSPNGIGVTGTIWKSHIENCPLKDSVWFEKKQPAGMEGRKEMFYLKTHSTHFIYGYMASDVW